MTDVQVSNARRIVFTALAVGAVPSFGIHVGDRARAAAKSSENSGSHHLSAEPEAISSG